MPIHESSVNFTHSNIEITYSELNLSTLQSAYSWIISQFYSFKYWNHLFRIKSIYFAKCLFMNHQSIIYLLCKVPIHESSVNFTHLNIESTYSELNLSTLQSAYSWIISQFYSFKYWNHLFRIKSIYFAKCLFMNHQSIGLCWKSPPSNKSSPHPCIPMSPGNCSHGNLSITPPHLPYQSLRKYIKAKYQESPQ